MPVHCIPNAGLPLQGPDGETIFPEKPEPLADLARRVRRALRRRASSAAAAARRPTTSARSPSASKDLTPQPRPAARPPHVSSMIAATPLAQEPRPTIVGERVNSQGSRKVKELLLADDYDGLLQIAEDQVEGGAHVLDVCVALTERRTRPSRWRARQEAVAVAARADQIDSTEPDVIEGRAGADSRSRDRQLRQHGGRRDKLDRVVPLRHRARRRADRADDRRGGMAKTRERKLEVARGIHKIVCDEYGLDREA